MRPITIYKCPHCSHMQSMRVERKPWMRYVPGSMRLECTHCGCMYMGFRHRAHLYAFGEVDPHPPVRSAPEHVTVQFDHKGRATLVEQEH